MGAVAEGHRQHLEMNGATRACLVQPRRAAYLKADVTKCRQLKSRAEQRSLTRSAKRKPTVLTSDD